VTESHISEAMRNAVGTEISRSVSYPVGENDIRRWAIATYSRGGGSRQSRSSIAGSGSAFVLSRPTSRSSRGMRAFAASSPHRLAPRWHASDC